MAFVANKKRDTMVRWFGHVKRRCTHAPVKRGRGRPKKNRGRKVIR